MSIRVSRFETSGNPEQFPELVGRFVDCPLDTVAAAILADWQNSLKKFHKVMPTDYKRALRELATETATA